VQQIPDDNTPVPGKRTEYHILGTVEEPRKTARCIVEEAEQGAVVVDLSAGQLNWPHNPHRDLPEAAREAITWINGQDLAPKIGEASRNAYIEWLSEAASQPVAHGRSIKEWFTYKGEISLWWFNGMSLKHPTNQSERWLFYQFFTLTHLADMIDGQNVEWHLWTPEERASMLRERIPKTYSVQHHTCEQRREKSQLPIRSRIRQWLSTSRIGETGLVLSDGIRRFVRTVWRLIRMARRTQKEFSTVDKSHPLHPETRTEPLVLVQSKFPKSWARVPESVDVEISSVWYDHYFGDAPAELRSHGYETGWLTSVDPESERGEQWDDVKQTQSIPDATPWMALGYADAWRIAYHRLKWALLYVYLFVWREAHSQWTYDGISLGSFFKNTYRWGWCTDAFVDVERYRRACASLQPEAVLYRDEFYLTNGRRLSAGGKGHAHLVGVQHGMVSREHTVYQWQKGDIGITNPDASSDHVHHVPAPDWFAAFGEHYVDQFTEWDGYPSSRVVPIGGVRHDVLVDQFNLCKPPGTQNSNEATLRDAYGLPIGRPVLLLCTATKQTAELWFEMVLDALEMHDSDAFVAVKLHQYHGGEEDVRHVAERRSFERYDVYTEDIYPLMAASDVLIGSASTTVLEGRLFGLECVAICAREDYQPYPFSRDGLASVVTDAEGMGQALRKMLEKEGRRSGSLSRHLNNEDGNAVHRLARFLDTVTTGKTKASTVSAHHRSEHVTSA
jgi:hypothetical protein